jgi:NADPH:quinone reductase-like Zn-dependent oxidoreductase
VPKPRILGADGAGVVAKLGDGVEGLEVGQRVVLNPGLEHGDRVMVIGEHRDGTHAQLIAVEAEQVFSLDDGLSYEQAAAFPLVYETAYRMLVTRAGVEEGEWALIWGIGGGVATAAFELCRALGVRTIVTSGSEDKLAAAREWGADLVINHHEGDVVAAVKEATGKGVHVVVETVGEATWARSLAAVRPRGRVVVCGATTGPNPPAQLHRFWWKQLTVMGSTMGSRDDFVGAYDLVRSGRARVHVDRVFPLAEIAAAHERLESGQQLGKIVIRIPTD